MALSALALLATTALGVFAGTPASGARTTGRRAAQGRPNIVLIQTDDSTLREQRPKVLPNTEQLLARHGTTFSNYIVTTAQCCPSRAALLTGQYDHNNGVTSNNIAYRGLIDKENVLPVWLQQAGYLTMHVGKFLNGYEHFADPPSLVAPGWDQWYTLLGNTHYYDYNLYVNGGVVHHGSRPNDNSIAVVNRVGVRLIRRHAPHRRPFYLQLDEPAPHGARQPDPSGHCNFTALPEPRDEGRWAGAKLPRPPSFNEANLSDKPPYLRSFPRLDKKEQRKLTRRWQCTLGALTGVDRGVKQVYDAVRNAGELNRTVFIFISDNGKFFGEHRIRGGKVYPYEEAIHLPLIMRVPGRYRDGVPRVKGTGQPVANIDLAPTILDLAHAQPCPSGGEACRTMDGRSLMPLLTRSGGWPRGRGLLNEFNVRNQSRYATCEFAGIRAANQIYLEHYRVTHPGDRQCVAVNPPEVERYDLNSDPFELHNLCFGGDPLNCPADSTQLDLEQRLQQLRTCSGIEGRDQLGPNHDYCE